LTHQLQGDAPLPSVSPVEVEAFRRNPDMDSYVGPPMRPTDPSSPTPSVAGAPPAGGEIATVAARAA